MANAVFREFTVRVGTPAAILLVLAFAKPPVSAGEQWPQYRGPNCSGISTCDKPLPAQFSDTENVKWLQEVGEGIGSPVVAADRVFVSAMTGEETIALLAFDIQSGKPLWKREWATGPLPEIHKTNSHASTTAAADAERVYFYFSTLGLLCVDAATGADRWQYEMPTPFFVFKWGAGMSPILYDDMVIFCQDDDLYPAIYAIDKVTGKLRWKEDRHDMAVNYSHPVVCQTESGDELIVAGTGLLIGYNPETGERLWHARTLLRNIKTTPVVEDGVIYISLQSGGIANQWLASVDRAETGNSDGKLTREEIQAFVGDTPIPEAFFEKTFGRGDLNNDGFLEGKELDLAFLPRENFAGASYDDPNPADEFIVAVRGGGRGDVTDTHVLWKHETRYTDHIVSPYLRDGRMLLIKSGGISTVFDQETGELLRNAKRIGNSGEYFASPVYGDGKIFVAGENGRIAVLNDGPEYELLSRNDMGESILATPAIADGKLFVRTRTRLICIAQ